MALIKRYPNRKLYHTETKKYITLEGIAELIRDGEEVQVIDHASGEELTTLTLTQIVLELEKKKSGFLPQSVLTNLVKTGGERLHTLRAALSAPFDFLRQVDEEIESRIRLLIRKGELAEEEGKGLLDKLLSPTRLLNDVLPSDDQLEKIVQSRELPTQKDIAKLASQLDALNSKLERLNKLVHSTSREEQNRSV